MKRKLACLVVAVLVCGGALALINPSFTPRHLVEQSDAILAGRLQASGAEYKIAEGRVVKGEIAKECTISLEGYKKDDPLDIEKFMKGRINEPVILFTGTMNGEKRAYLHIDGPIAGTWLNIAEAGKTAWKVRECSSSMPTTYAGGTDQLIRMAEYLNKDSEGDVPVNAGVRWMGDGLKVGKVDGDAVGVAGVEIGKDKNRKVYLFASSSEGDKLFLPKTVDLDTKFEEVTKASGLDTKSRCFAWVDVNKDGLADLVSWDGTAVTVRLADEGGKFKNAGAGWTLKLESDCSAMTAYVMDGAPGVLVSSASAAPILLAADKTGWKKIALPDEGMGTGIGQMSPCVVGDLDSDGLVEVLQPGEQGGMLWKAKAGGFEKPVKSDVGCGGGMAKVAAGDYNQDGALDIFLSGSEKNSLWENNGKGRFTEVFRYGGSISYKCAARATDVQPIDLNHDGRPDICLTYEASDFLYHFNRGYRSFGEEGEVRLPGLAVEPGQPPMGQKAMCVADFDASGSEDLAVVLRSGDIRCFLNDKYDMPGMNLRLGKGATGPITASCWQGDQFQSCWGTVVVSGSTPPAYVTCHNAGKVTLKWQVPGKGMQTKTVSVENKTTEVTIE